MKRCSKCGETKPYEAFYLTTRTHARRARCIECFLQDEKDRRKRSTYQKDYSAQNSFKIRARKTRTRNTIDGRAKAILGQARRRANNNRQPFDVTLEWVIAVLENGVCQRSGVSFDLTPHVYARINPRSPSLDKINSFGHYVIGNVQLVCDMYNRGKGQTTDAEFIAFCKAVVEHNL